MKDLICIICPKGCHLTISDSGDPASVKGHGCKRGITYATDEIRNPLRTLTTTVRVSGGAGCRVAVKTQHPIPKSMIFETMRYLDKIELIAPVNAKQVVIDKIPGTDIAVITTASCI